MDWSSFAQSTPLSVPDRLSVDLEKLILGGELSPGDRLPSERELATMLNVSRVSVREALRELENRGLIDRKPGRGTIVLDQRDASVGETNLSGLLQNLSPELHHIMELRSVIEPPIARITAEHATARDIAQLGELVEAMEGPVSAVQYAKLDRMFHQAIAQYTHNPLLAALNEQISQQINPSREHRYQTKERRMLSSAAHRRIYEAIAERNGDLAEYEARDHVLKIRQEISRTVVPPVQNSSAEQPESSHIL